MTKNTKKVSIDDLATMVAAGFENTSTKADITKVENRLDKLEQGQEEIKMRLDNVAYRFEVKDLEKRVERLENKAGIHR